MTPQRPPSLSGFQLLLSLALISTMGCTTIGKMQGLIGGSEENPVSAVQPPIPPDVPTFTVERLISNLAGDASLRVIDRIRASISRSPEESLTASAGFAVVATPPASEAVLFQAADEALMSAKEQGRNRAIASS